MECEIDEIGFFREWEPEQAKWYSICKEREGDEILADG